MTEQSETQRIETALRELREELVSMEKGLRVQQKLYNTMLDKQRDISNEIFLKYIRYLLNADVHLSNSRIQICEGIAKVDEMIKVCEVHREYE